MSDERVTSIAARLAIAEQWRNIAMARQDRRRPARETVFCTIRPSAEESDIRWLIDRVRQLEAENVALHTFECPVCHAKGVRSIEPSDTSGFTFNADLEANRD